MVIFDRGCPHLTNEIKVLMVKNTVIKVGAERQGPREIFSCVCEMEKKKIFIIGGSSLGVLTVITVVLLFVFGVFRLLGNSKGKSQGQILGSTGEGQARSSKR